LPDILASNGTDDGQQLMIFGSSFDGVRFDTFREALI